MGEHASATHIIPGAQLNVPPELLGPTGQVFIHPRGYSTHLNVVADVPGTNGKFSFFPLLVPGQVAIDHLLSGGKPTSAQMAIARSWAAEHREQLPLFDTTDEALSAERTFHERLESGLKQYLPDRAHLFERTRDE